jgi:hypothetical protein
LFTSNVGGLSSYDRVFLAPVNIYFLNVLKRASLTDEKWFVSTNGYSWLGSDNAIPGGVDSWALDPFGPGECVTLGWGLVNQQVTPLVEVSDPFFVT